MVRGLSIRLLNNCGGYILLNYGNLNDVEFEYLCQDIMQEKLAVKLHRFAPGKDGGVDLCDNVHTKNIVVQVKHYGDSTVYQLISSLKKEQKKVEELKPNQYYVCCSKVLSPQKTKEIFDLFSDYMDSPANIITLNEIDDFLTNPKNIEILKKHYKLWIESTGILQDIASGDTFIDCEVLLSNINKEQSLFVQTEAYNEALHCLKNNRTLFIVGNPGVGKTITSKMLVLYYAAEGYKVRFTTNTSDLQALKKSISRNPEEKEIILIDDCFGQAYFQMKDSQNNELLSLIKYVNISSNKLLILNSRVTIFKEAKERSLDLVKSFENDEYKVFIIDMNALSIIEKAKIFYNHLSFNKMGKEYFEEIKKDKRYRDIIKHPNYNPRIIEFICNPKRYEKIPPKDYYTFIDNHLKNPKEIWKDEYEIRLQKTDRILLSIIYSFSDLGFNEEDIKKCFNTRIKKETDIDVTINQYEASLKRLLDGLVVLLEANKTKKLAMANPSINDYFDSRLKENLIEKEILVENSTHINQIKRLLSDLEYEEWGIKNIQNRCIDNYEFTDKRQENALKVYFIGKASILDTHYTTTIYEFLLNPSPLFYRGISEVGSIELIESILTNDDIINYYNIIDFLSESDNLSKFLEYFDVQDLPQTIDWLNKFFVDEKKRTIFIQSIEDGFKRAIDEYCDYVDADDYNPNVETAVYFATSHSAYEEDIDTFDAVSTIEEEVECSVKDELFDIIKHLPVEVDLDYYIENSNVSVYGAESLVDSYLDNTPYDSEYRRFSNSNDDDEDDEVDYIFDRKY